MKPFFRVIQLASPLKTNITAYFSLNLFLIIFGLLNYTLLIPILSLIFDSQFEELHTKPIFAVENIDFSGNFLKYLKNYFSDIFRYSATANGKLYTLLYVCSFVFMSVFLSNLFRFLSLRLIIKIRVQVLSYLRKVLYKTLLHQSLSFYQKKKSGELLTVMSSDVFEVEQIIGKIFEFFLRDPYMVIFYFTTLFYLSPSLTLFTIFYFPIAGLVLSRIVSRLRKRGIFNQEVFSQILNMTNETILGIKIIKAFSIQNYFQKKFDNINKDYNKNNFKMSIRRDLASPLSEFLGVTMMLVVVVYGGYLVIESNSHLTGPVFITYIAIFSQVLAPVKNVVNSISALPKGLVSARRIFSIIDMPHEVVDKGTITKRDLKGEIQFKKVHFSYIKGKKVLNNVDFNIKKGQVVALVGKSGSGKTTIMDLLLKFYTCDKGSILIDDIPIEDINVHSLRNLFGIVTQEPILFNDTIEKNIAFGVPYIDKGKVIKAAKVAYAHDFITKSENGYKTIIGDRGIKLSGGQKQRVTIARAVYHNPPILLMDEATSSLDTESEKIVQMSLTNIMKNRTSLIIAHRLSTIQKADLIIVLDKGRIVEKGNHKELMKTQGIYADMVKMQKLV